MYTAQRVIKGLAVGFAIFLIGVIFSSLIGAGMLVTTIFGIWDDGQTTTQAPESSAVTSVVEDFDELRIDVETARIEIVQGERFELVADEKIARVQQTGKVLRVEEDSNWWSSWGGDENWVKVVLPRGVELNKVVLDAGAGTVTIDKLIAEEVELNLGAGRTEIGNLAVQRKAKIESGAGVLEVKNGKIQNLDLEMGAGKVDLKARLLGKSEIEAGLGQLSLTLVGENDDYNVTVDQGIGGLNLDGVSLNNTKGENRVEVDGGVGVINLRLIEENI